MVFMQVKSAGNHRNFKQQALNSSSSRSGVGPVSLDRTERAFRLNAPVHAKQCAVNAVQVFDDFFVNAAQFLVQSHNAVPGAFTAFRFQGTVRAVFALPYHD